MRCPRRPSRPACCPAGSRLLPLLVQTHAAPAPPLSSGPPTMAVLPSAERDTESPCHAIAHGARADQLAALLGPDSCRSWSRPTRPQRHRCRRPSDDGRVAVGGEGHGYALMMRCPRRPSRPAWFPAGSRLLRSASRPTRPQRHCCRRTLRRWPCCRRRRGTRNSLGRASPHGARADQLGSLLGPDSCRSSSRPTRPQRHRCRRTLRRWPCCRRRRGTRTCLDERSPRRPSRPAWLPCWVQTPALLVQTHAAPVATVVDCTLRRWPCCRRRRGTRNSLALRAPTAPVPNQLRPLLRELRERWLGRKQRGIDEDDQCNEMAH